MLRSRVSKSSAVIYFFNSSGLTFKMEDCISKTRRTIKNSTNKLLMLLFEKRQ